MVANATEAAPSFSFLCHIRHGHKTEGIKAKQDEKHDDSYRKR